MSDESGEGRLEGGLEVAEPLTGGLAQRPRGVSTRATTWEVWIGLQGWSHLLLSGQ